MRLGYLLIAGALTCPTIAYSAALFGHEIGHLQGARHNCEADSSLKPVPYGAWLSARPLSDAIMSYNCSASCPRLQY